MSAAEVRPVDPEHPAWCVDLDAAARAVSSWLLGEAPHWDPYIRDHRPDMSSLEGILDYTMEGIQDHAFHSRGVEYDVLDPQSEDGRREIADWCASRAAGARDVLLALPVVDGGIRAHRMIGTDPAGLRSDLGIFWTHSLLECVDPYPIWAPGGRDAECLCIEAVAPLEAIDWQTSCMAMMDWYTGDAEQELRLRPGHRLRIVSCEHIPAAAEWTASTMIELPAREWRT